MSIIRLLELIHIESRPLGKQGYEFYTETGNKPDSPEFQLAVNNLKRNEHVKGLIIIVFRITPSAPPSGCLACA